MRIIDRDISANLGWIQQSLAFPTNLIIRCPPTPSTSQHHQLPVVVFIVDSVIMTNTLLVCYSNGKNAQAYGITRGFSYRVSLLGSEWCLSPHCT